MPLVGVSGAARSLAVSPQRVRAMLAAGLLEGRKLEGVWLVDLPMQLDSRLRPRRRPMSPAQAWRSIALMSGMPVEAGPSVVSHLRARLRNALVHGQLDDQSRAGLMRAWFRDRADAQRFYVPDVPMARLRNDHRVLASGGSHPDSPVHDASQFEGYVLERDLNAVVKQHAMVPSPEGRVLLRVVSEPEGLRILRGGVVPIAAIAADLAEHDDARSISASAQLIADVMV